MSATVPVWSARNFGSTTMLPPTHDTAGGSAASGNIASHAANFLCLAAMPTFAVMALLACIHSGGPPAMLCSLASGSSPLSGMVPMYALMSAFHSVPWLRLIFSERNGAFKS
jgi:hypothetical protein